MFFPELPRVPIPGPRPLPFLGPTGNLMRFFADPVTWLFRLHRDFGMVAALCEGSPAMVFAFGPENNRHIIMNPNLFHHQDRMILPVSPDSALKRLTRILVMMNGEEHRRTRRLLMPAFQKSTIEGHRDAVIDLTERALARLRPGAVVDVSGKMLDLTSAIVIRCMFGIDDEEDASKLGHLGAELLAGVTSIQSLVFPVNIPGTPYARVMKLGDELERRFKELIEAKREMRSSANDALSILIRTRDEDGSTFTDLDLVGQCFLLYMAGYETTAHTLSWTLFLLSQHPQILADLRDEVRGRLRGDTPAVSDLAAMPLLDAVVKESMRIIPAASLLFARVVTGEATVGGYALPKGTSLMLSPLVSHHMSDSFPEPRRFLPDRWRTTQPSPHEYLPLGVGPRMCIGAGFSAIVVRLVIATIVQRRRFVLCPNARVSLRLGGITLGPKHGLPMYVLPYDGAPSHKTQVLGDVHKLVELS
jgi:cytochrome P450